MEGSVGGGEDDGQLSPGAGEQAEPAAETPETDAPPVLEEADAILEKPKQSSEMPKPEKQFNVKNETFRDVFLWRRKKASLLVLFVATTIWVLLELCGFRALTLIAWTAMAAVAVGFAWNIVAPLFRKETIRVPKSEISEKSAADAARRVCRTIEDGLNWVLTALVEKRDVMVFGEIIAALWVVSIVGSWFDLITFAYLCMVLCFVLPVTYLKYEGKIKKSLEAARRWGEQVYKKVDEKFLSRMKFERKPMKEKKAE
ncbi:reticulon-like protein B5 [Nymphaea colorata]|uniref:reticulon-like protein B5 n=1 Tax=Nymphaea colorata TaxID=210225 RepID=UPI00214ED437|nr:reticulon-like protein B5 [Nymphaea colorata]